MQTCGVWYLFIYFLCVLKDVRNCINSIPFFITVTVCRLYSRLWITAWTLIASGMQLPIVLVVLYIDVWYVPEPVHHVCIDTCTDKHHSVLDMMLCCWAVRCLCCRGKYSCCIHCKKVRRVNYLVELGALYRERAGTVMVIVESVG
jgi:hypothetical protein